MEWINNKPFAHRGLHKGFKTPENSMKAFKKALKKGYGIELDVRLTKDNKLVVFHDKNLRRVVQRREKIRSLTYEQLQKFNLYHSDEKIPLLSDVLELVNGQVPILIEVKNYGIIGLFENHLYDVIKDYTGDYAICSFNPKVVLWFKRNHPEIKRGIIYGDIHKFNIKFFRTVFIQRFFKLKPDFVSLDFKLIDTIIPKFCKLFGTPITSWTIDSKKKKKKALRIVDNIVFEGIKG